MIRRVLAIPRNRRRLLIEAAWFLILARVMLRCLRFPRLAAYFSRPALRTEIAGVDRELVCRDVRRAVERMADLLPGATVCFPRGIAVQAMLRRRGVSTTLYYGANGDGALTAHVWVQDGDRGVIGKPADGEYTVVATYPACP